MTETDQEVISDLPVDLSGFLKRIVVGSTYKASFTMLDDNEDPQDTTGWAMEIVFKKLDGDVVATLTTPASGVVNTPADGRFDMTLSAVATAALNSEHLKITVKVTDAVPETQYIVEGVIPVYYP